MYFILIDDASSIFADIYFGRESLSGTKVDPSHVYLAASAKHDGY